MTDLPPEPPHDAPAPSSKKRLVVIAGLLVVALVVAGVLLTRGGGSSKHTVVGVLTLHDASEFGQVVDRTCNGAGGYDDLSMGGQVKVTDDTGKILATSVLDRGKTDGHFQCVFTFTVVVPDASFYGFAVGHRAPLDFSSADLKAAGYTVGLKVG